MGALWLDQVGSLLLDGIQAARWLCLRCESALAEMLVSIMHGMPAGGATALGAGACGHVPGSKLD